MKMKTTMEYFALLLTLLCSNRPCLANWNEWWTYDGISGPTYWGVINPAWHICNRGRHQSPIDIQPSRLVFDETLTPLKIDKLAVEGVVYNTGQSLMVKVDKGVNITGGPLAYRYEFSQLFLHWGPDSSRGSEHTVDKRHFAGEVQILGYNSNLYKNLSHAMGNPHGVVALALMLREEERGVNGALAAIAQNARKVPYRGQNHPVPPTSLVELLPSTETYMTYDGSSTQPGCSEGFTWIVLNRPAYLSPEDFAGLREIFQGEKVQPKSPLGGPNARPLQELHGRSVRTNIAFSNTATAAANPAGGKQQDTRGGGKKTKTDSSSSEDAKECPDLASHIDYRANSWGD